MALTLRCVVPLALLLATASSASAQVQFVDVSTAAGLTDFVPARGMGTGIAAADYDGDGDVDLFVPTEFGTPHRLYRNDGGVYAEVAADAGLDSLERGRAALWLDTDGDALLDLLVAGDCFNNLTFPPPPGLACPGPPLRLFRQMSPGSFTEVDAGDDLANTAIQQNTWHVGGLTAGDINGDGFLDVLYTVWGLDRWLLRNNGDGTFTDITVSSGLDTKQSAGFSAAIFDFDGDGWRDIYQAIDFTENLFWSNQGDETFVDVAPGLGVDNAFNEMGLTVQDVDNDGDFDLFMTNIFGPGELGPEYNLLYRNDSTTGGMAFTEVAAAAGVDDSGWGWGATFFDADRDGHVDLAATNGFVGETDTSKLFLNDGVSPLSFSDVSAAAGFADDRWGSGLVAFDHDGDGDADLVQTTADTGKLTLLENQSGAPAADHHWLVIRPRMGGPNGRAIGAIVHVEAGGKQMARFVAAGTSSFSQEPAEAFFGLGTAIVADRVTVEFPDGTTKTLTNVAADQALTIRPLKRRCGLGFELALLAAVLTGCRRRLQPT